MRYKYVSKLEYCFYPDLTNSRSLQTVVDISNVSLMRFWQLKAHMQRASALASANYAETLGA